MRFVHALSEQSGKSPTRYCLGNLKHRLAALIPSEVHIGLRFAVELAGAFSANVVGWAPKARQIAVSVTVYLSPPISVAKLLEVGNSRLFKVIPEHPGRMEFGIGQPVPAQYIRHLPVGIPPMPDRDRNTGEDEVGGVTAAGARCA